MKSSNDFITIIWKISSCAMTPMTFSFNIDHFAKTSLHMFQMCELKCNLCNTACYFWTFSIELDMVYEFKPRYIFDTSRYMILNFRKVIQKYFRIIPSESSQQNIKTTIQHRIQVINILQQLYHYTQLQIIFVFSAQMKYNIVVSL